MSNINKKIVYCKHCGQELENGVCVCGADFNNEKRVDVKKIKCDTCKKLVDIDSKYCPYCGVPVGTDVYNEELKRELRGDFAEDVLSYMKKGGQNNTSNDEILTPGLKKFIVVGIAVLLLLFVVKGIMFIKENTIKQQELLEKDANKTSETVESKTEEKTEKQIKEQPIISIRDNWIRKDGYFYCLNDDKNLIIDDWVEEKDKDGNIIYYYFDMDGKLVVNSWINDKYYVGEDGIMYADKMTPDGIYVDKDGEINKEKSIKELTEHTEMKVYYEAPDLNSNEKPTNHLSSSSASLKGIDTETSRELYIKEIKKVYEMVIVDSKKYKITYYFPVIDGVKEKEVTNINELILEIFPNKFKKVLTNIKDEQGKVPKTIVLNEIEQTQLNSNRFIFIVSGRLSSRSGPVENKKFRFIYDRKSKTLDMLDISKN